MWTYSDEDEAEPSRPLVRCAPHLHAPTQSRSPKRCASAGLCADTRDGAPSEGTRCVPSAAAEFCLKLYAANLKQQQRLAYGSFTVAPAVIRQTSARPPPIVQQSLHRVLCCACWLSALLWRVLHQYAARAGSGNIRTVSESAFMTIG
jgi:hypothetical protein